MLKSIQRFFQQALADGEQHHLEEHHLEVHRIRRLAELLHVSHSDFIRAKLQVLEDNASD